MRGAVKAVVRDALLACFDAGELRQFAASGLGVDLDHVVAAGDDLTEQAWELVGWAERNGRLGDLVWAAGKARPAATEWQRLSRLVGATEGSQGEVEGVTQALNPGARRGERGRRLDYESGSWEQRIEGKLDRLTDAVGALNVRLSLLEERSKKRGDGGFPPHLVWMGLALLAGMAALGVFLSARLP